MPWAYSQFLVFHCYLDSMLHQVHVSLAPFLAMKASGRRVNMGGQKQAWPQCASAWQPPAAFSEALSWVFSANFQAVFTPLQINAWRLARQRAAENLETVYSGNFTDTCYELHNFLQFRCFMESSLPFSPLHFFSGLHIASVMPCLLVRQVLCHCIRNCDSDLSLSNEPFEVQIPVRAW